jgi:hypothetical protein
MNVTNRSATQPDRVVESRHTTRKYSCPEGGDGRQRYHQPEMSDANVHSLI